jgi:hypothetical protein
MGREIGSSTVTSKFPPSVALKEKGDFIQGKIVEKRILPPDSYGHNNPVVSLQLINMEGGNVSIAIAKGEYQEVEVGPGDVVDLVGRNTTLRQKLGQVKVGETITVTYEGLGKAKKGRQAPKLFKVIVDEEAA